MSEIYVHYDNNGGRESAKEEYGDWSAWNDYTFHCLTSTQNAEGYSRWGERVSINFKPKLGEFYYMVWVDYDTGDSFGRESNCMTVLGVYETIEKATELQYLIKDDMKNNKDNFDYVKFHEEKIYTGTWKGYFEKFNGCRIERLEYRG